MSLFRSRRYEIELIGDVCTAGEADNELAKGFPTLDDIISESKNDKLPPQVFLKKEEARTSEFDSHGSMRLTELTCSFRARAVIVLQRNVGCYRGSARWFR